MTMNKLSGSFKARSVCCILSYTLTKYLHSTKLITLIIISFYIKMYVTKIAGIAYFKKTKMHFSWLLWLALLLESRPPIYK